MRLTVNKHEFCCGNARALLFFSKEKIKAVKLMLINQSRTWWSMLSEDSLLAEKGDIHLPDIEPQIFTLLLKHSYGGLETLDDLSVDVVMKLCYCADKYLMKTLMTKTANRLAPQDVDGVFPALHCFTYHNLHGLEISLKKIVQSQTKKIFEHSEFLKCDVDSIIYICKQDTLDCDELTLWKAVVRWAKHQAQSEEGAQLRRWMSQPLQYVRLLTLTDHELLSKVISLSILSGEEVSNLCLHKTSQQNALKLRSLCYEMSARYNFDKGFRSSSINIAHSQDISFHFSKTSSSYFLVESKEICLQAVTVKWFVCTRNFERYEADFFFSEVTVNIWINVTKITDLMKNTTDEEPISVNFCMSNLVFDRATIPTMINNKGITLEANSKYKFELIFNRDMPSFINPQCNEGHEFEHGTFLCCNSYQEGVGLTPCHIIEFTYTVAVD